MKRISLTVLSIALTSCYAEPQERYETWEHVEDVEPERSESRTKETGTRDRTCHFNEDHAEGCVEGDIATAHSIQFQGVEYFDANDLNTKLKDNLDFETQKGISLVEGADYELTLLNPFSNDNFSDNFEIHVKGTKVLKTAVRNNGKFYLNNLPDGFYKVRAQRPFNFIVHSTTEEGDKVEKSFCATIYGEQSIDVFEGQKVILEAFDSFELFIRDIDCGATETSSKKLTI